MKGKPNVGSSNIGFFCVDFSLCFFPVLLEKARFEEYNNKNQRNLFAHHTAESKMDSCEIGFYCD